MLPASWYNDDDDDLVSFLQNKDVLRRGYNKGVSQKHVFDDFFWRLLLCKYLEAALIGWSEICKKGRF